MPYMWTKQSLTTSAREERETLTESGNYNHDVKYLVRLKDQIKAARGQALGKAGGVEGGAENVDQCWSLSFLKIMRPRTEKIRSCQNSPYLPIKINQWIWPSPNEISVPFLMIVCSIGIMPERPNDTNTPARMTRYCGWFFRRFKRRKSA